MQNILITVARLSKKLKTQAVWDQTSFAMLEISSAFLHLKSSKPLYFTLVLTCLYFSSTSPLQGKKEKA